MLSDSNVVDLFQVQTELFPPRYEAVVPKKVSSLDEFSATIRKIKSQWDVIWYRGCKDVNFDLQPSLFRVNQKYLDVLPHDKIDEQHVFNRLLPRMKHYVSESIRKDQTVCLAQHLGFPTRLLDWSESLGAALYFALPHPNTKPCIWLLNPERLNQLSTLEHKLGSNHILRLPPSELLRLLDDEEPLVWDSKDKEIRKFMNLCFEEPSTSMKHKFIPRAFAPDFINRRMELQHSCFTIHADERDCLTRLVARFDVRVRDQIIFGIQFSEEFRRESMAELRELTPSPLQIFGDVHGLFRELLDDELWGL